MLITPEYVKQNAALHAGGEYGFTGHRWASHVEQLARAVGARTILDYGCGTGSLGAAIGDYGVVGYDPAIPGKDAPPSPADVVACVDVLEHVEPDCLAAVLDDLRRVTVKALFLSIPSIPARKTLPDGRNAHLIVEQPKWWLFRLLPRFDLLAFKRTAGGFEGAFV